MTRRGRRRWNQYQTCCLRIYKTKKATRLSQAGWLNALFIFFLICIIHCKFTDFQLKNKHKRSFLKCFFCAICALYLRDKKNCIKFAVCGEWGAAAEAVRQYEAAASFFYMKFVINQSEQTLLRCYHSVATDEVISLSEIFFHTHCIV